MELNLASLIREYMQGSTGRVALDKVDREIGIIDPKDKNNRWHILERMVKAGEVEKKNGFYRYIDKTADIIDWQKADPKNIIELKHPFELEKYVKIFPKSIICVAGGKDAGKTRMLHDYVLFNMHHPLGVDLFNSETGKEQLRERFEDTGIEIPNPPPFRTFERYDNFADVIDPDRISVIDYLDLNSEVYMVGDEIDRIFRKLKGVVIIGLQKPPPTVTFVKGVKKLVYRDLAYGSGFSAKRAILYISLDNNIMKLVVAKTPISRNVNPKNKMWSFWIENGAHFRDIKPYTESEEG